MFEFVSRRKDEDRNGSEHDYVLTGSGRLRTTLCESRIVAAKRALGRARGDTRPSLPRADVYKHADLTGIRCAFKARGANGCGIHRVLRRAFHGRVADILSKPYQKRSFGLERRMLDGGHGESRQSRARLARICEVLDPDAKSRRSTLHHSAQTESVLWASTAESSAHRQRTPYHAVGICAA